MWQRLRPLLQVFTLTALAVAILNAASWGLSLWRPDCLPQYRVGRGFIRDAHARIEAAADQFRDGMVKADRPLCVVIGVSDTREGFDLARLAAEDGVECRYLG